MSVEQALLYVLDLSGIEEDDPVKTLKILKDEISAYECAIETTSRFFVSTTCADVCLHHGSAMLALKPSIIFLNKTDMVDLESYAAILKRLKRKFKKQTVIAGR